jgi:hypothetical protein
MMTREEFEKAKTFSHELAAALKPYTDESAVALLLCAVIGIAMHGGIPPWKVIKTFTELCEILEEEEDELLN